MEGGSVRREMSRGGLVKGEGRLRRWRDFILKDADMPYRCIGYLKSKSREFAAQLIII